MAHFSKKSQPCFRTLRFNETRKVGKYGVRSGGYGIRWWFSSICWFFKPRWWWLTKVFLVEFLYPGNLGDDPFENSSNNYLPHWCSTWTSQILMWWHTICLMSFTHGPKPRVLYVFLKIRSGALSVSLTFPMGWGFASVSNPGWRVEDAEDYLVRKHRNSMKIFRFAKHLDHSPNKSWSRWSLRLAFPELKKRYHPNGDSYWLAGWTSTKK